MHVFVTGATGWVGSRVVDELLRRGHSVLGLARSDASAAALEAKGVAVQRGGIEDLESLKAGVTQCDATIHTAFIHDFSDYVGSLGKDLVATKAMIDALKGTGKVRHPDSLLAYRPLMPAADLYQHFWNCCDQVGHSRSRG